MAEGTFNYQARATESSLFRNGRLYTTRDIDGNEAGTVGVKMEPHQLQVLDARQFRGSDRRTLDRNGFELIECPLRDPDLDFFDSRIVVDRYYDECAEVVRDATGASRVFAFDHNVRSSDTKLRHQRLVGGQEIQNPARMVHGDYTLWSGPQRLRDFAKPPTIADAYRSRLEEGDTLLAPVDVDQALESGRFALINLWRNIAEDPVARDPMALCDAQTIDPDDLVVFEVQYHDRVGENYTAKYSDRHQWNTYPGLTREEALLIKQWDSAGPMARSAGKMGDAAEPDSPCTCSFHTAFSDPATPEDAPDRLSIEVRCIVVY